MPGDGEKPPFVPSEHDEEIKAGPAPLFEREASDSVPEDMLDRLRKAKEMLEDMPEVEIPDLSQEPTYVTSVARVTTQPGDVLVFQIHDGMHPLSQNSIEAFREHLTSIFEPKGVTATVVALHGGAQLDITSIGQADTVPESAIRELIADRKQYWLREAEEARSRSDTRSRKTYHDRAWALHELQDLLEDM